MAERAFPTKDSIGRGPSKSRFEVVYREGKRAAGNFCRISALPGKGFIGIATSRKIGTKPARNKVRRRFKEALRLCSDCIETRLDYVVVIGIAGAKASLPELTADARPLLTDLSLRWAKGSESF